MGGATRKAKKRVATAFRNKGSAHITQRTAQATGRTAAASDSCKVDPYDFDIGLTDTEVLAEQTASGDAEDHAIELGNIQSDWKHSGVPVPHPPALKQQTAQHESAFLQRLVVKQEDHAVSWSTDSESSSDWGDGAEYASADGSAQPMRLHPSLHNSAAAAALNDEPSAESSQLEQSESTLQPSKSRQEDQAQAPKPLGRSGESHNSDRPSKGPVLKRQLSAGALAASQGSSGSRKRKAGPGSAMDGYGRGKGNGKIGATGWQVTSAAQHAAAPDTQDAPACASKGPTVMEAQECGEQFQLQDDIQYALDGLCASALPSDRASSAAQLAEMAATRRGRLALRAGGLFQDVMGAASRLHLDKEPLTALSIAFVLLAFARDRAEQAALCQGSALSVLKKLLQSQDDANVKTGDGRTMHARTTLARILKDSAFIAAVPIAQRLSPCSLATAALAGALDPQQASASSEELKAALLQQGVLRALAELAADCAARLAAAPKGDTVRPLWNLHRCLLTLEYATFACPANEQALVHIRPAAPLQPSIRPVHEQTSAPGRQAAAALVSSERGNGIEPEALPPVKYSSAPELSCSPKNGMMSCMQLSQEDSQGKQARRGSKQAGRQSKSQPQEHLICSSAAAEGLQEDGELFPAWLTRQATSLFPSSTGAPSRGLRRDCLQCMLSVLMNLTHNNAAGTAAVVSTGGLEAAAHVVDSVLGPPEEEALFVRIADRRRLLECLDLVSTTLGLLINLAEQDKACQPLLAGLALPHGRRMVPLLCRLMQACGKQSDTRTPRKPGSPGLEVTEEQLVAGEEEGAASIVEVYAALLLGFVTESDLAQQKVVDACLDGGMTSVTAAVKRCLQFYVDANAITAKTEASLRLLIASLEGSDQAGC